MSRDKPKVIHHSKFASGRISPEQAFSESIRKKCTGCGGPPAVRILVFVPHDEFVTRQPVLAAAIAATNPDGPFVPVMQSKYGPLVRLSDVSACSRCRLTAIKTAAKAPSYAVVEIRECPAQNPVFQVPGLA